MIAQEYGVKGMTCESCVNRVEGVLADHADVKNLKVQLDFPQITFESNNRIDRSLIEDKVSKVGNYSLTDQPINTELSPLPSIGTNQSLSVKSSLSISTYRPLIIIISFILGVSVLVQFPWNTFSWMRWMNHFMAGFFIVFSFFKLLNLQGFAKSYAMYDLLAAKWKPWGYLYPWVELLLGVAYLIGFNPVLTNSVTAVVLGFSTLGVVKSNLDKKKIQCACLGDVFDLPMSTVTIVEDLTLVLMAVTMLLVQ